MWRKSSRVWSFSSRICFRHSFLGTQRKWWLTRWSTREKSTFTRRTAASRSTLQPLSDNRRYSRFKTQRRCTIWKELRHRLASLTLNLRVQSTWCQMAAVQEWPSWTTLRKWGALARLSPTSEAKHTTNRFSLRLICLAWTRPPRCWF